MRREIKKKQTRAAIILNAIKLFKQKGFENVTVEEITAACGIAKGTFFNYFPKKEHILLHIMDVYMERLQEILQRHQQGSLLERIKAFFVDLLSIYQKHNDISGLILRETIRNEMQNEIKTFNLQNFEAIIIQLIEQEKRTGRFVCKWDTSQVASLLFATFLRVIISHGKEEQSKQMIQQQVDIVWEGIVGD